MIRLFFTVLTRSIVSIVGVGLTTVSAILFLTLFAIEELGGNPHGAYTGIIAFVLLPAVFVFGLLLMPIGVWRVREADRRRAARGEGPPLAPVIDLNVPRTRGILTVVGAFSILNIVILATGTYKGLELMESTEFCGDACHSVMNPEHSTHSRSAHSRVRCTQCHIGPGAKWFVKSKLAGSWQLLAMTLDIYPRPIHTPVETLRPARETCEQCHWPTRFVGERLKVITRYQEDEVNTEKKTVLMLKVGGTLSGRSRGIHWHVDPKNEVRFRSDRKRKYVKEIVFTLADGTSHLYTNRVPPPQDVPIVEEWRTMDCVDCHNRPTHVYQRPKDEMDRALSVGELDRRLPFIRREGLRILRLPYSTIEEAESGIRKELFAFYEKQAPELVRDEPKRLDDAASVLATIYKQNVFPEMKVTWDTYPSLRDHEDDGGCFRCHNSDLQSAQGKKISQKCDLCHTTLAEDEENPEILAELAGD